MNNLSLNEIASRIAEVVLEKRIISRPELIDNIIPVLKIWIKKADATKKYRGKNTPKSKLQYTIDKEKLTSTFWLQVLRNEIGEEKVKPYYENQQKMLKDNGF